MLKIKLPIQFDDGKAMYDAVLAIIHKHSPVLSKMVHDNHEYNPFSIELPDIVNVIGLEIEPFFKNLNGIEILRDVSYKDLLNKKYDNVTILVQFNNTTFSRKGYDTPIPDPNHILQSLKDRWNQLFPDKIDIKIPFHGDNTREYTVIKFLNIHSATQKIADYRPYTVFYGKVGFKFYGDEAYVQKANILFRFAEFAGVGLKRQMGMGVTKILAKGDAKTNDDRSRERNVHAACDAAGI
ncbi:CRISPR system precrRNA processing endoribonuclease RAMP protein Cas6 [Heyndrickxia coagulans]|uniref:CRISPR system precrRNA processing endoribonuclease RAMP protein Cas6 n=1 Tax=Heyndrickxia coagulans TaxID=1398 RepID=UPI0021F1E98A|nr:CRISPR system precrRNA processing endoribonuclease RAMP protein Cas6 [Heyndrickxia coagulans]UYM81180.1 CRISPR system precrRNA processing endoribonuclease RAMP protein Cas6 [Heyndrickxia coagulans]